MKWRWRVSHVVAVALLGFGLTCVGRAEDPPPSCEDAVDARDWQRVVDVCVGAGWEAHARLGQAWLDFFAGDPDTAIATAESLMATTLAADAHYLVGYAMGSDTSEQYSNETARDHLEAAVAGYLAAGRHGRASTAAAFSSRVPRAEGRFENALASTDLAVREGDSSGDARTLGQAWQARAEVLDSIGKIDAARAAFGEAKQRFTKLGDLAFVQFKYAEFVLDLGDFTLALELLDEATELTERAKAAGLGASVKRLELALPLNKAEALSQLRRFDEAERELATVASVDARRTMVSLVRGLVAARKGNLAAARRWIDDAGTEDLDSDFAWPAYTELAGLYRKTGQIDEALGLYQKAIEIIERMRADPSEVDMRPWILARRRRPYVERLDLLAGLGRGAEALEVAESLHARALLDVVLSRTSSAALQPAEAVRDTELRLRALSAPSLSRAELLQLVGTREALVFVTVDDGFWRFHIANGEVTSEHLGRAELRTIEEYRAKLDDDTATRAGKILLPADLTESDEPLILVGDVAWQTPFAALRWRARQLRELRSTVYLPGLAALSCSHLPWDDRKVLLGDADGDLPEAAREVSDLSRRFSTPALTGAAVTWGALATARHARLLHVAVHGRASRHGMALGLRGGEVVASQILEAGIAPAEVVLSGCNTANPIGAPESWSGFPSAFLSAGSRFVISTLQSVDDKASAEIVAAYYQQRASGLDPARALTAAQRAVGDSMPTTEWASFTAWGSPSCELP